MGSVFLIPTFLAPEARETITPYAMEAVKNCTVIFAENERTARRFLKAMDRELVIDNFEWYTIDKNDISYQEIFRKKLKENIHIAIMSEAGCPGVADPGQQLVAIAHENGNHVKPFVGPNSILLALMASGLNGQHFEFIGYLPIDNTERQQKIIALQAESNKKNSCIIFIETPYRNEALYQQLLKSCHNNTSLCLAINITAPGEKIETHSIEKWKRLPVPVMHKIPVIFLLQAGKV
ncbi:MAG: SAM-dependent methyltransferase [Ferruginibacter sp.]